MIEMTYATRLAAWRAQHDAAVTYSQPAAWTYAQVRTMPTPEITRKPCLAHLDVHAMRTLSLMRGWRRDCTACNPWHARQATLIESIPAAIAALSDDMAAEKKFDAWMEEVDAILCARHGVTTDDIEDMRYRDWFDAGVTPRGAVNKLVRSVG